MEKLSLIIGMISPFVTLFMGWIFDSRVKKREKQIAQREAEIEEINKKIERMSTSMVSLDSKIKACQRVHDTETINDKIDRVIYINEKTLAYCLAVGKLSKMVGRVIIENPDMYPTIQTEIKDVYRSIVSYDTELNERIMNSAMTGYKEG